GLASARIVLCRGKESECERSLFRFLASRPNRQCARKQSRHHHPFQRQSCRLSLPRCHEACKLRHCSPYPNSDTCAVRPGYCGSVSQIPQKGYEGRSPVLFPGEPELTPI